MTGEWIRFVAAAGLLVLGLIFEILAVFGVNRFHRALNRMHAAATGDTLGIGFALLGLIVMSGFNFTSLKLFLVIVFLWFSSPVSSHLIARLEVSTNEESGKRYRTRRLDAPRMGDAPGKGDAPGTGDTFGDGTGGAAREPEGQSGKE